MLSRWLRPKGIRRPWLWVSFFVFSFAVIIALVLVKRHSPTAYDAFRELSGQVYELPPTVPGVYTRSIKGADGRVTAIEFPILSGSATLFIVPSLRAKPVYDRFFPDGSGISKWSVGSPPIVEGRHNGPDVATVFHKSAAEVMASKVGATVPPGSDVIVLEEHPSWFVLQLRKLSRFLRM